MKFQMCVRTLDAISTLPGERRDVDGRAQVRARGGLRVREGHGKDERERERGCRDFLDTSRSAVVDSIPRVVAIEISEAGTVDEQE